MTRKGQGFGFGEITTMDQARPWEPHVLRRLLDLYLTPGVSLRTIAEFFSRTQQSIYMVLFDRLPRSYTEGGRRESLVAKVLCCISSLDYKRAPTVKDKEYLRHLVEADFLNVPDMAGLLNLPEDVVIGMKENL